MTMSYHPTWTDGLTHADAEQIRRDNLDWYARDLVALVAEYDAANAEVQRLWTEERYSHEEYLRLAEERDSVAYRITGVARLAAHYAPGR